MPESPQQDEVAETLKAQQAGSGDTDTPPRDNRKSDEETKPQYISFPDTAPRTPASSSIPRTGSFSSDITLTTALDDELPSSLFAGTWSEGEVNPGDENIKGTGLEEVMNMANKLEQEFNDFLHEEDEDDEETPSTSSQTDEIVFVKGVEKPIFPHEGKKKTPPAQDRGGDALEKDVLEAMHIPVPRTLETSVARRYTEGQQDGWLRDVMLWERIVDRVRSLGVFGGYVFIYTQTQAEEVYRAAFVPKVSGVMALCYLAQVPIEENPVERARNAKFVRILFSRKTMLLVTYVCFWNQLYDASANFLFGATTGPSHEHEETGFPFAEEFEIPEPVIPETEYKPTFSFSEGYFESMFTKTGEEVQGEARHFFSEGYFESLFAKKEEPGEEEEFEEEFEEPATDGFFKGVFSKRARSEAEETLKEEDVEVLPEPAAAPSDGFFKGMFKKEREQETATLEEVEQQEQVEEEEPGEVEQQEADPVAAPSDGFFTGIFKKKEQEEMPMEEIEEEEPEPDVPPSDGFFKGMFKKKVQEQQEEVAPEEEPEPITPTPDGFFKGIFSKPDQEEEDETEDQEIPEETKPSEGFLKGMFKKADQSSSPEDSDEVPTEKAENDESAEDINIVTRTSQKRLRVRKPITAAKKEVDNDIWEADSIRQVFPKLRPFVTFGSSSGDVVVEEEEEEEADDDSNATVAEEKHKHIKIVKAAAHKAGTMTANGVVGAARNVHYFFFGMDGKHRNQIMIDTLAEVWYGRHWR